MQSELWPKHQACHQEEECKPCPTKGRLMEADATSPIATVYQETTVNMIGLHEERRLGRLWLWKLKLLPNEAKQKEPYTSLMLLAL